MVKVGLGRWRNCTFSSPAPTPPPPPPAPPYPPPSLPPSSPIPPSPPPSPAPARGALDAAAPPGRVRRGRPLEWGSGGFSPGKIFEILLCCRWVLAQSCMLKCSKNLCVLGKNFNFFCLYAYCPSVWMFSNILLTNITDHCENKLVKDMRN